MPDDERSLRQTAIVRLLGFNPSQARVDMDTWLDANPDASVARRCAVQDAFQEVDRAEESHVPARLAAAQDAAELTTIERALSKFMPRARKMAARDVRGRNAPPDRLLAMSEELHSIVIQRLELFDDAKSRGRPRLHGALARIEAKLRLAGFEYGEIADLIQDTERAHALGMGRDAGKARAAHVDRIEKRVAQFLPSLVQAREATAAVDRHLSAWLAANPSSTVEDYLEAIDRLSAAQKPVGPQGE